MKGVIFNIFESFIVDTLGSSVYEEVYHQALPELETKEAFVGPGTYPDTDLLKLLQVAVKKAGISVEKALHAFGVYTFPKLVEKAPHSVKGFNHPMPFLKNIHDVIHVEVKKVYSDATPPNFYFDNETDKSLSLIHI